MCVCVCVVSVERYQVPLLIVLTPCFQLSHNPEESGVVDGAVGGRQDVSGPATGTVRCHHGAAAKG